MILCIIHLGFGGGGSFEWTGYGFFSQEDDDDGEFSRRVVKTMANWPQFAGWPAAPPAQPQQRPGPPLPFARNAADYRPVTPFLQHAPRMSPPSFHQFPPQGTPPPPGPHGQTVYPSSPGYNSQGWIPNPRVYPGPMPISRPSSPNVFHAQSQNFPLGNHVSGTLPCQIHGLDQQSRQGLHDSWRVSTVPMSNDVRPNFATKPLFLDWIDESVNDSSSLGGDASDRVSTLKSSDLYKLVDVVEETIGKIFALTDLKASGTEWGLCPFNPGHVLPVEALLRHTLQCNQSTVDAGSLLHSLQYPDTVDVDPNDLDAHEGRMSDYTESSSNHATLSFEDTALLSVNFTPIRKFDCETLKQESSYVETENLSEISGVEVKVGIASNRSEDPECTTLTLSTSRQQFDPRGSLFFYGEAPGVVLTSVGHCSSQDFGDPVSSMPPCLRVEMQECPCPSVILKSEKMENPRSVSSTRAVGHTRLRHRDPEESHGVEKGSSSVRLLPSILWGLGKDLDSWKHMPSSCSRTVLEAATCLGRVKKALIVEWLLVHSPVYGVALDMEMATHISYLVQLYLKALETQSSMLLDRGDVNFRDTSVTSDSVVVECPAYAEASTWLASWLAHLYGPSNSKAVVLDLLKHCLNACGRLLSIVPLVLHSQQASFGKTEDVKTASDIEFKVFIEHYEMLPKEADNAWVCVSNREEVVGVKHVSAAMDALYERANFERYVKSELSINNASKTQRIADYDMKVTFAGNERAKRPNYRAVCEHDGLTWQRSQQEEKRNKTKVELLAEERDYKRRRMSYRGKKLKRTPLQVLHDIIENHMIEITEVGGIGCFSKQPLHVPAMSHNDFASQQLLQGSSPSNPDFLHHSESAHHSRATSRETAFNVSRRHDEHKETSSDLRNESRSRRKSRFDDERHHTPRR